MIKGGLSNTDIMKLKGMQSPMMRGAMTGAISDADLMRMRESIPAQQAKPAQGARGLTQANLMKLRTMFGK